MMSTELTTTAWVVERPTPSSTGGAQAVEAADGGDDEAGEEWFGKAFDDITVDEGMVGGVEEGAAVEAEEADGDECAAGDAGGVGDDGEEEEHEAVATRRGATSFRTGSVPRARMASICSETFMEPSSLAMPDVLRPETMRPVRTGPSSLTMESATRRPVMSTAPNCLSEVADWRVSTQPVKKPVRITMGNEPKPTKSIWVKVSSM